MVPSDCASNNKNVETLFHITPLFLPWFLRPVFYRMILDYIYRSEHVWRYPKLTWMKKDSSQLNYTTQVALHLIYLMAYSFKYQ